MSRYVNLSITEEDLQELSIIPPIGELIKSLECGDFSKADAIRETLLTSENNISQNFHFVSALFSYKGESNVKFERRLFAAISELADNNYMFATYIMGLWLDTGEFGQRNSQAAISYFNHAATLGHPRSQYLVGICYFYGTGGHETNQEEGLRMLEKAANNRCQDAIKFLETLKS
jgi:TPR repeat protein